MTDKETILKAIRMITTASLEIDEPALAQAQQVWADKNTVGVGYGYKISEGKQTNERALMLFVEKKKKNLPIAKAMPPLVAVASTPITTDVVETGPIKPQPLVTRKPLQPGYSVGHFKITAGTFGAVVTRKKAYQILSNSHVLADSGRGKKGDAILYPGKADGGVKGKDTVGKLARFRKFKKTGETVDCATAAVDKKRLAILRSDIKNLGVPKGTRAAKVGMNVTKTGRTTATTTGKVIATDATIKLNYGAGVGDVSFVKQVVCTRYSQPGDSGSLVLDKKTKKAVGLHFAGGPSGSFFNPISLVLKSLGVKLVTKPIKVK